MIENEYDGLHESVNVAFKSLYEMDVDSLTLEQKEKHQEELSIAYLAVIRLENRKLSELTDEAKQELCSLSKSTLELRKQLTGLKETAEILEIISGALEVLTAIAKLLK